MGRPSLNVKPTLIRLPDGVPERIDALVGRNRRAAFIREAVERELERRETEARATEMRNEPKPESDETGGADGA